MEQQGSPRPNQPLLRILADQPAAADQLDFTPYARTLAEIIADPTTDTPLTIGVFGDWGQGKTSLLRMVQGMVQGPRAAGPVRTVWFNAWLYSHQEALCRALLSQALAGVREFATLVARKREDLERLEARLYGTTTESGHLALPAGTLPGLEGAALPPLLALELLRRQAARGQGPDDDPWRTLRDDLQASEAVTRRDQIAALDEFRRQFEGLKIAEHGRLVVFIDDLDRCLPDQAVEVLEAVKLFLDVPGCVFVLGVDRAVIEQGIHARYAAKTDLDGARYLEKIIQIPFALPPLAVDKIAAYVRQIAQDSLPDPRCETVFSVGLEPNPRRIKRTLNIFLLLWRLSQNRADLQEAIKPARLAKIVVIQQYYPALFKLITAGPRYLVDLERRFRAQERGGPGEEGRAALGGGERWPGPGGAGEALSAGPLSEYLGHSLLRALLTCTAAGEADANFADVGPAGVREYVYLTRGTVEEAPPQTAELAALSFEPQLVTIPAGPFLMGAPAGELAEIEKLGLQRKHIERETPQHEVTLAAYAIGRYPVTNAEFARFIAEKGYATAVYWTAAGWQTKERQGWLQPRSWEDPQWNGPSQPVVGVSWYEAAAYCRWLAEKTGRPYRLPTEAEWEKAARGPDGRRYPWGDQWDAARCNNQESGPGHTTPVGQYPGGDSPYGVGEMVGQVWEWCGSRYGGIADQPRFGYPYNAEDGREDPEGDDTRILRGGSYANDSPAARCRCGYRDGPYPGYGFNDMGFRCARTSPAPGP